MNRSRQAAFVFIFITVLLDMLAFGIVAPVMPKLIENFLDGKTARAAEVLAILGTVWAFAQFLSAPVLGGLSDRFGRRPVILASNVGLALDFALMAWAPNLVWFFVGRMLSAFTSASYTTAGAYIADVTPPQDRAARFGMLGAAFGIGFILGPAFGGLLAGYDLRLPFWAAAGLGFANALYGLFVLPESLPPDRRSAFSFHVSNPLGALRFLGANPRLRALAAIVFLSALAHAALPTTYVLFAGYRFGWDEKAIGLTLAIVGASSMAVQAGLVGPAIKRLGEWGCLVWGLAFGAASFGLFAFGSGPWFLAAIPVSALWGLAGAAYQSLMTAEVGPTEQGQLQGAIGSLRGIADLVGPGLFPLSFALAIQAEGAWHLPGMPFILAAVCLAGSALLAWPLARRAVARPAAAGV